MVAVVKTTPGIVPHRNPRQISHRVSRFLTAKAAAAARMGPAKREPHPY